ncbi:ATP-binding protein [Parvularcula lutaonensis]|uniref:Biotin carboxylase N-terminal domain-containing protein n=1 Tax=Parvularcula lutaonensis TaxID=491923 RepID=A0ABV7MAI6_9PROT|nr:biotin carboxylase N-terminal domain-containing protein [Parvularcula lutaonensis]GGY38075.1 geranyl-CoA carboxylase subunit alpha [Parvularcula lutaonensis]
MAERFTSLLVANRGEIACRVIRTAKALGYRTVAVASEADRDAPHAKLADQCIVIGPAPVGQSYLDAERILKAAKESRAEAIHPGYGFLSENADFAREVEDAGLVFVGPSPEAIDLMGDKARAKRAMIAAGVPCIPGYEGEEQDEERFVRAAEEAGYPVMVKAAAGGGGRGMRIVRNPDELPAALQTARSEAENAFGSGDLILEKAVENARHVEVQVFGDAHGTIIHLGERDCSLQRRHQKVIEEAPSPAVDEALRQALGKAAVEAARAVSYRGAGTVEFLLADDRQFYFLEMNTRLQVEHPVTEEVTGLDLVALQLNVAQGEPLGLTQEEVRLRGHSIEARLYAEDPAAGFLPATGPVHLWRPAPGGRTDAGIETGGEITPHYDPLVAKVIARGDTRDEAIRKLNRMLEETALLGPVSNRRFLIDLVGDKVFRTGEARTNTIDSAPPPVAITPDRDTFALAAAIQFRTAFEEVAEKFRLPKDLAGWSSAEPIAAPFLYEGPEGTIACAVRSSEDGCIVDVDGEEVPVGQLRLAGNEGTAEVGDNRIRFAFVTRGPDLFLSTPSNDLQLTNKVATRKSANDAGGVGAVTAVMHGLVTSVFVEDGERVEKGQRLATLEAMKMQHEIAAPVSGVVTSLPAREGAQVGSGELLVQIEPDTEE